MSKQQNQPPTYGETLEEILSKYSDHTSEQNALGLLMLYGVKLQGYDLASLNGVFSTQQRQIIFEAITRNLQQGEPANALAVYDQTKGQGVNLDDLRNLESLGELAAATELNAFDLLIERLKEFAARRRVVEAARRILHQAAQPYFDYTSGIQQAITTLENEPAAQASTSTMQEAGEGFKQILLDTLGGTTRGVPTGFNAIDRKGGFNPGDLIIIGADTSIGKTSFAWCTALHAAKQGTPLAFVSLEMSKEELFARATAQECGIPAHRLTIAAQNEHEQLTPAEAAQALQAANALEKLPIYFEGVRSVEGIISRTRYLAKHKGIKGVYVDYLQILATNGVKDTTQFLTDTARRLQELAKELNIFVCALSQLSRPQQSGNMAVSLTRLRGSQEIAAAADLVIMLTRPEIDGTEYPEQFQHISKKGTALVSIDKGRKVGTFKFVALYNAALTQFAPIVGTPPLAINDPAPSTFASLNNDNFWDDEEENNAPL